MRFLLLFIVASTLAFAAWIGSVGYDAFLVSPADDARVVSIHVEPGSSVKQIAAALEKEHLIDDRMPFELFVRATGTAGSFKAGSFDLKEGMSYAAIVAVLTVSSLGEEVEITIPEGYTAKQIGVTVRAALPHIISLEWDTAVGSSSPILSEPLLSHVPKGQGLEGYLFPDTYRFRANATAEDVARIMVLTLGRRLAENDIPPDEDLHKTLTLASIIEREVRSPEEMRLVSDVFWKRLKVGMALQADSTVNYATGGNAPGVSYKDLQIDSPYNTYKYPGLPPGPIANPGMNAIKATLDPEPNAYFYYLTTPEGEVKYGATFEDHIRNRTLYLR